MKKSLVLSLLVVASCLFAGEVVLANCGKGVTIRNDNETEITITQISYRPLGAENYTIWPNKQGQPMPRVMVAGESWTPVMGNLNSPCEQTIEVKVDYTIGGVASYEVDAITNTERLVTVEQNEGG